VSEEQKLPWHRRPLVLMHIVAFSLSVVLFLIGICSQYVPAMHVVSKLTTFVSSEAAAAARCGWPPVCPGALHEALGPGPPQMRPWDRVPLRQPGIAGTSRCSTCTW
jgi:hypothetical protein